MNTTQPILKSERETKKVQLKSIPGGEVEIYTSLTAGDIEKIVSEGGDRSFLKQLTIIVKGWNLVDENGNALEPTEANLAHLTHEDAMTIVQAAGFLEDADGDFLGVGGGGTLNGKKQ